jgi:hypothetical protein
MVNLVAHVKQDMYSVDCCSFNVHGTVSAVEQSEVHCLNCALKRDRRVSVDIVLMRLWDAGTLRNSIRNELFFKYFLK